MSLATAPSPAVIPKPPSRAPDWQRMRRSTRILLLVTKIVLLVGCLELASRAYWLIAKKVPLFHTGRIWNSFYPEFDEAKIHLAPTTHEDGVCDVLVLGPSVWHWIYGDLGPRFEKALQEKLGRPVKVYNLSNPGRTTRDAVIAYRKVADKRFDLVVVYHGINDHFLNNCPRALYRDDYTHAPRFHQIKVLESHPEHSCFVLPYTLRYLRSRWGEQLHLDDRPHRSHNDLGVDLKTPPAFRANLEEIAATAKLRGEPLVLLTFASHIPANYTEEAFQAKQLDYDRHHDPLRIWGTTESVPLALRAHNGIVRDVAAEHAHVHLVDMARRMPGGKAYYHDACHLTPAGCARFVDELMAGLDWKSLLSPSSPEVTP